MQKLILIEYDFSFELLQFKKSVIIFEILTEYMILSIAQGRGKHFVFWIEKAAFKEAAFLFAR